MRWLYVTLAGCSFSASLSTPPGDGGDEDVDAPNVVDPTCAEEWTYTASNIDPCEHAPVHAALTLGAGAYTFDPATGVLMKDGAAHATLVTSGSGSPRVLSLAGLVVEQGANVRVLGTAALVIAVHGDATIAGILDVSASGTTPGPGAAACTAMKGADALAAPMNWSAGGGGAGGAFGTRSGAGGTGDSEPGFAKIAGGTAMDPAGSAMLVPLRGGCRGGAGGEEDPSCTSTGTPGTGGGAGGAIQLTVRDMLTITSTGRVAANGGGGQRGINGPYTANSGGHVGVGGGGGGSGGGILVESRVMAIETSALLCANGGGGGGGSHNNDAPVTDGANGTCSSTPAPGGTGVNANGGAGAAGATAAAAGAPGSRQDDGGGGGGGGGGRIRVRAVEGTKPSGFGASPAAVID